MSFLKVTSRHSSTAAGGERRVCEPFPRDKFSARRLPALPELCQKYFSCPHNKVTKKVRTVKSRVRIRLPLVKTNKNSSSSQDRDGGTGGSILYEDDWTIANLPGKGERKGAPVLRHYWNISGEERQRIISCPQHNLVLPGGETVKLWRIPARSTIFPTSKSKSRDISCTTQRLIKTAENFERGSLAQLDKTVDDQNNNGSLELPEILETRAKTVA